LEPIGAIIDPFTSHSVVALSEDHGNEQGHAFRLELIRDTRFGVVVNDIVVEFGNALYQERMDRFIRGEDVPYAELREVWQNTTQAHSVWDRPIYEEFFRTVRSVNASLPRERQLRVLLGDPPVDWKAVTAGTQRLAPLMADRDRFPAALIHREVLATRRRALVIYGGNHLFRAGRSLVRELERMSGTRVFTVALATRTSFDLLKQIEPAVNSWRAPAIAFTRGTSLDS
jgi:hypothetical protein